MAAERTARVVEVVEHAPATRALRLALPPGETLVFRPGQFVACLVPDGDRVLNRPYSLASDPGETPLEILVDRVPDGPGSGHLFARRPGDTVRFTGPWGTFTLADALPSAETIFVAEGSGIAPIRPMLREATRRTPRPPLRLLYGTRLGVYRPELERLPGLAVDVVAPERVFDDAVRRWVDGDADRTRHFFVCGVGAPVLALRDRLRAAGYARRAVQYERW
jgi:ferredoxin-NADP reductase